VVEDIAPFNMIDWWQGFVLASNEKEQKPSRKAHDGNLDQPTAAPSPRVPVPSQPGQTAGEPPTGALSASKEGAKLGSQARMPEPLPPNDLTQDAWEAAKSCLRPTLSPITQITCYGKTLVGELRTLRNRNVQEAKSIAVAYGLSAFEADMNSANNPHIREGKPYNKAEFYERVRHGVGRKDFDDRMPYLNVEASGQPERVIKDTTDQLVDSVNGALGKATTPEARKATLKAFIDAADKARR
jgi:hypothetical protein